MPPGVPTGFDIVPTIVAGRSLRPHRRSGQPPAQHRPRRGPEPGREPRPPTRRRPQRDHASQSHAGPALPHPTRPLRTARTATAHGRTDQRRRPQHHPPSTSHRRTPPALHRRHRHEAARTTPATPARAARPPPGDGEPAHRPDALRPRPGPTRGPHGSRAPTRIAAGSERAIWSMARCPTGAGRRDYMLRAARCRPCLATTAVIERHGIGSRGGVRVT
jgi:hypothetical protein